MNRILTIALHELRVTFRRRAFIIITAAVPFASVVALVVFQIISNREAPAVVKHYGYVDATGLFTGHLVQGNEEFQRFDAADEGIQALLKDDVERLYVIPAAYVETGLVARYQVGQGLDIGSGPDPALRAFLIDNLTAGRLGDDVIARVKDPAVVSAVTLDESGKPRELTTARLLFFLGLALLLMMSVFISSASLLQSVAEEKENRIMEVLLSCVTPGQLMTGKVLGLGAAALGQVVIWVASGIIAMRLVATSLSDFQFEIPGAAALVGVTFFVLGYLFLACLMAGIGAMGTNARESGSLSSILVVPMIVPIYMSAYILLHPTSAVVRVLTFIPFTAPVVVLQRLAASAIQPWEVALSALTLALFVGVAIFLSGRIFQAYLLSYGRWPRLTSLWRTVTGRH